MHTKGRVHEAHKPLFFVIAILLGSATAKSATAGTTPVVLESQRIDDVVAGFGLGQMLVVDSRRMLVAGNNDAYFRYLNDSGNWVWLGSVPWAHGFAIDAVQAVYASNAIFPWPDDTGVPDFAATIGGPDIGTTVAIAGDVLVLGDTTVGRVRAYLRTGDMWSLGPTQKLTP